jgi:hypothetical protein
MNEYQKKKKKIQDEAIGRFILKTITRQTAERRKETQRPVEDITVMAPIESLEFIIGNQVIPVLKGEKMIVMGVNVMFY